MGKIKFVKRSSWINDPIQDRLDLIWITAIDHRSDRSHHPGAKVHHAFNHNFRVTVIEDCAHTMGGGWGDVPSGRHGLVGCYSCQTYKHVNSGEGGLFVTNDPEVAARAVMLSGSYMLYDPTSGISVTLLNNQSRSENGPEQRFLLMQDILSVVFREIGS